MLGILWVWRPDHVASGIVIAPEYAVAALANVRGFHPRAGMSRANNAGVLRQGLETACQGCPCGSRSQSRQQEVHFFHVLPHGQATSRQL
jgi:hypothetical protein